MKTHIGPTRVSLLVALATPVLGQSFAAEDVLIEPPPVALRSIPMDVDGDGRVDILTAGGSTGPISWIRNDPNFGFIQQSPLSTQGAVSAMVAGDVDLDGDLDLVVGEGHVQALSWVENLGNGVFGAHRPILTGPFSVTRVEAGDFDGDGDDDYAMQIFVSGTGSRLAWVENVSVSGLGVAFAQPQLLSTAQGRYTDMIVADVDGDGDDDLLAADETAPAIILHENIAGAGLGAGTVLTTTFTRPYHLRMADMDSDGVLDLLATHRFNGSLDWAPGLGGGAFGAARYGFHGSREIRTLEVVDLNGDGATECLISRTFGASTTTTDDYFLYPNTGGAFGPRELLGTHPNGFGPNTFLILDADDDGDPDVVATGAQKRTLHVNDGTTLGDGVQFSIDIAGARDVKAADLDGDGDAELILALSTNDDGLFGWIDNQGGVFGGLSQTLAINTAGQVDAIDIDQDGDLDLVSAGGSYDAIYANVRWAENLGQGTFADSTQIYGALADSGAVTTYGDMEGDGDLDIFLSHREGFSSDLIHSWVENGPLGFTAGPSVPNAQVGASVQLADMDGDGDGDFVYLEFTTGSVLWRRNRGTGTGGQQAPVSLPGSSFYAFDLGDVDGDGDIDVVAVGLLETVLFTNTGVGAFAPGVMLDPQQGRTVLLRDVNLDGLPDVFVSTPGAPARWQLNLGGGSFAAAVDLPGSDSFISDVADLDGDLDLDILKRASNGAIVVNRNTDRFGTGYCGPAEVHSGGISGAISASGSPSVASNDVQLRVERLPASTFGFFLIADGEGFVANPGGSQGDLCLGGAIGRLLQVPGAVFLTGSDGAAQVTLDLTRVPRPFGPAALVPGDTRYAQAWFRDTNPTATSNFTNGLKLEFQ